MREVSPILLLGAAFLFYQYTKKQAVVNRYYAGIRVQIASARQVGNDIVVTFRIQNPNSNTVVIRSLVGDVFINGGKVGNAGSFQTINVLGNAETYVPINVRINALQSVAVLANMITAKNKKIVIKFVGTINVNNIATPLNLSYKML